MAPSLSHSHLARWRCQGDPILSSMDHTLSEKFTTPAGLNSMGAVPIVKDVRGPKLTD